MVGHEVPAEATLFQERRVLVSGMNRPASEWLRPPLRRQPEMLILQHVEMAKAVIFAFQTWRRCLWNAAARMPAAI